VDRDSLAGITTEGVLPRDEDSSPSWQQMVSTGSSNLAGWSLHWHCCAFLLPASTERRYN
jgi:hypothetical protein